MEDIVVSEAEALRRLRETERQRAELLVVAGQLATAAVGLIEKKLGLKMFIGGKAESWQDEFGDWYSFEEGENDFVPFGEWEVIRCGNSSRDENIEFFVVVEAPALGVRDKYVIYSGDMILEQSTDTIAEVS